MGPRPPAVIELREDAYGFYEYPPDLLLQALVIVSAPALFGLIQSYNGLRWAQYGDDL